MMDIQRAEKLERKKRKEEKISKRAGVKNSSIKNSLDELHKAKEQQWQATMREKQQAAADRRAEQVASMPRVVSVRKQCTFAVLPPKDDKIYSAVTGTFIQYQPQQQTVTISSADLANHVYAIFKACGKPVSWKQAQSVLDSSLGHVQEGAMRRAVTEARQRWREPSCRLGRYEMHSLS